MAESIDLNEVIRRNRTVDLKQLREAWQLLEELRRHGVTRPGYDLLSPFQRQPQLNPDQPGPTGEEDLRDLRNRSRTSR